MRGTNYILACFPMLVSVSLAAAAFVLPGVAPPMRRSALVMQEPGTSVDLEAIGWEERTWAKRVQPETTDDGACFIVPDDEAPEYTPKDRTRSLERARVEA